MVWIVIIIVLVLIPEILSTVLDSRLGQALAVRLESGVPQGMDEATAQRIQYLEGEVDRLSEEVHRLNEESEFMHELLANRKPSPPPRIPPGESQS
jgi:hypothetical protein